MSRKTIFVALACHGSMLVHAHWERRALLSTLPDWCKPEDVKVAEYARVEPKRRPRAPRSGKAKGERKVKRG